jgi:hypothetical protein
MERWEIRVTVNVTGGTNRDDLYGRITKCLSEITNEHREDEGIVKVVNVGITPDSFPRKVNP